MKGSSIAKPEFLVSLNRHALAGVWPPAARRGSVTLAYDDRHRRRVRLTTDAGEPVLLDLRRAVALQPGDGLGFADGSGWLEVRAADEDVLDVTAASPDLLLRLAWHLGNRHTPTELSAEVLRIRYDHVLEAMIRGLGGRAERNSAPFHPEAGAYAGHGHTHAPADRPGHAHD